LNFELGTSCKLATAAGMDIVQVTKSDGKGMVFQDLGDDNYSFKYFAENLF
jgi:hypothetical protein